MDDDATKLRRDVWDGGAEADLPEVDVQGTREQIWGQTPVDPEMALAPRGVIIHDVWGAGAELEIPVGAGDEAPVEILVGDEAPVEMLVGDEASVEMLVGDEESVEFPVGDEAPVEFPVGDEAPVATPHMAAAADVWAPPPADLWPAPAPERRTPSVRDVMLRAHGAGGAESAEPSERGSGRAGPPVAPDAWLQRSPHPSRRRRKAPQTWSIPFDSS